MYQENRFSFFSRRSHMLFATGFLIILGACSGENTLNDLAQTSTTLINTPPQQRTQTPTPSPTPRVEPTPTPTPPPQITGWVDPRSLLVDSDGSCSLGNPNSEFNNTRDQGSKIAYFDVSQGDNVTADVYWYNGSQIIDSNCSAVNPTNNLAYGTDPLNPNHQAIRPFATYTISGDDRLQTQRSGTKVFRFAPHGGYPDWFLFRRGQRHTEFDAGLNGGRSENEPMVVSSYGDINDGRAIMEPSNGYYPFKDHNWGFPQAWYHVAMFSLEMRSGYGHVGMHVADSYSGGPVTAYIEDCYWPSRNGGHITYATNKMTLRRSILHGSWVETSHNQGYYTAGYKNQVTMDEVVFYKNGYKSDPTTSPDPKRDIYSRNIYQGGGAKMGHTYRNMIIADGASGGPQMRFGGLAEDNLIIEGYWFSSTQSNSPTNEWLASEGQTGQSAVVRNNVQLIFQYPTLLDPDTHGVSDQRAQPSWGYILNGASFGAIIENNIISGAMLTNDLGQTRGGNFGFNFILGTEQYQNNQSYSPINNTLRNNITYKVRSGIRINGDGTNISGNIIENNIFSGENALNTSGLSGIQSPNQLLLQNNRFYSDQNLPTGPFLGNNNTLSPRSSAATNEGWSDPDRTLKRYVTEVLGLTLLDWDDDPFLDAGESQLRKNAGEIYDPSGMKTFMAVAINMRNGGTTAIPSSGKPSMMADYAWDERFSGKSVVNWIRAGFNLPALP